MDIFLLKSQESWIELGRGLLWVSGKKTIMAATPSDKHPTTNEITQPNTSDFRGFLEMSFHEIKKSYKNNFLRVFDKIEIYVQFKTILGIIFWKWYFSISSANMLT